MDLKLKNKEYKIGSLNRLRKRDHSHYERKIYVFPVEILKTACKILRSDIFPE